MTRGVARRLVIERMRRLPKRARDNLLWHAENGTPILCRDDAQKFYRDDGGG